MTNDENEQHARTEVIKALISCGDIGRLRGELDVQIAIRADPLVRYILGEKPKKPRSKKVAPDKSTKVEPENEATTTPAAPE